MNFKRIFNSGWLILLAAVLLTSCHGMWDDEGQDCTTHRHIRFTYDWNMLFADAFPHEVKTLTLYAFNEDSTVVYRKEVSADSVIAKGYMDVDDLPAGKYRFQVWAQGEERYAGSYVFGSGSAKRDLTAAVNGSGDIDHDFNALYYGASGRYGTETEADFTDMPLGGTREAVVNLMKNTENIRIVLQNETGETLNPSDFSFTITDDNGALDANNSIVAGHPLAYHAWSVLNGEAGVVSSDNNTITGMSALVAEFTTNRFVEAHNESARLIVRRVSDGKEIINIPVIKLGLIVKGNYNRAMSDQDYLDRQDTWNFVFFLTHGNWLSASIQIQQWRVVLQASDL